jgi:glycosyltransferase involved in cell wall biosynthesis
MGEVVDTLALLGVKEPYVLYVGRLTARKNVDTLIRALTLVRTPTLTLVIVGGRDKTSPDLSSVAANEGVSARVLFMGPMDVHSRRLRVLFAAATAFCFPSLEESFGLPPLEAMASGTPAVVSNLAAIMETCGNAAIYVDPMDHRAIAEAIDRLVADKVCRMKLRSAGLNRASAFTWERSALSLLSTARLATKRTS